MPKNIPGIVKRSKRRPPEKVRILVQPNPYPLEQPGMQPNVSGPMTPPMQPGVQPGMQPNASGPMTPPMQPGVQPGMQPNASGPMTPPMQPGMPPNGAVPPAQSPPFNGAGPNPQPLPPGGLATVVPPSAPVVPMQSNGQWRGDPNAQTPPPLPQGQQPWQQGSQPGHSMPGTPNTPGTPGMPNPNMPNMPQQPGQPMYNNQPWGANAPQQPVTPPQMPRPSAPQPYHNGPMQPGRATPPPAGTMPPQPMSNPGLTPAPQYSPIRDQRSPSQPFSNPGFAQGPHAPSQPVSNPALAQSQPPAPQPPTHAPQPQNAGLRAPSNSGLLGRPPSVPGVAGAPALNAPPAHILIEIDGKTVQEVRLDKPVLTLGRQDARDIQIKHQSVSRTHARLLAEGGTWIIEDAGSVNGIVFQGKRVQRIVLNNGDRVFVSPNIVLVYKTM